MSGAVICSGALRSGALGLSQKVTISSPNPYNLLYLINVIINRIYITILVSRYR
jgi:hypothetical protein